MGTNELALALRLEGTTGAASAEVERLVGVAEIVATLPDPEIDPVFAAKLEQRLLTEGLAEKANETSESYQGLRIVRDEPQIAPAREEKVSPNVVVLPRRRFVVRKAIAGLIAAALAMAMPVAMASTALPSSPGYFIKEARRALQIQFASEASVAFVMAKHAQEYLAEAAQLVEIGARSDLISSTLAKARRLLAMATQITIRGGKPAEIAALRTLIEREGDVIRTMLPGGESFVLTAIFHIESLSDALARAMGIVLTAPADAARSVSAIAASVAVPDAKGDSASKSSDGSKAPARKNGSSNTPTPPVKDPGEIKPATPGGCEGIGERQLGSTLDVLNEQLCAGYDESAAN